MVPVYVDTHNPPRAKTPMRAIFCLFGSCKELRTGIGRTKITRSVRMCIAALENHSPSLFRQ